MKAKKLLSAFVAGTMALSMMSFTAFAEDPVVAKIGETTYTSLEAALEGATGADIKITLLADATLDIAPNDGMAIGGDDTGSITIKGDAAAEKKPTLTFNCTNSDWNNIATKNGAVLKLENLTITNTRDNTTAPTWNGYGNNFACPVELNNVDSLRPLAFHADATLNKVNVTDEHNKELYAIWITADGQTITATDLNLDCARGIKIDNQYVSDAGKVELNITESTIKTANKEKPAILVNTPAGVAVEAKDVDITAVAGNKDSLVVIDEDTPAEGYTNVTVVRDGEEEKPAAEDTSIVAVVGNEKCETLADAIAKANAGDIITLLDDTVLSTEAIIKNNITIDLNDYTVASGETTFSNWFRINDGDLVIKNGTLDISNIKITGEAVFVVGYHDATGTPSLALENVNVVGENYSSAFGVFYAYKGPVNISGGSVELKGENANSAVFQGNQSDNLFTITNSNIKLDDTERGFSGAKVAITGTPVEMVNIGQHAMRNISGTITNSNITVNGAETGIKNDNGKELEIAGTSKVSITNTNAGDIVLKDKDTAETTIVVKDTATLIAENVDDDVAAKIKPETGANVTIKSDEISVKFEKVEENNEDNTLLYNIVLAAKDNMTINRLTTADLTFAIDPGDDKTKIGYEIEKVENINFNIPAVNRYAFNLNGVDKADETGKEIIIAQVKFTGAGAFTFMVNAEADTNEVHTTKVSDNIVDDYVVGGGEGVGTLVINGVIDAEIKVPQKALTVNVTFPNAVSDNVTAYQKMTVTISGGDLTKDIETKLGKDDNALTTDGKYVVTENLTKNVTYTVTVKGDGYRTARHTVTMTDDKTLTFWNNVMDNDTVVEEGKTGKTVTFLAGDIVKDNNINIYDLSAVVSYFGETMETTAANDKVKYDLNRDGKIDSKDVAYVLASWNN